MNSISGDFADRGWYLIKVLLWHVWWNWAAI